MSEKNGIKVAVLFSVRKITCSFDFHVEKLSLTGKEWVLIKNGWSQCKSFPVFQHNTIEAVLERGEKIDDLVEKSEGLSMQSKTFYKTVSSMYLN